MAITRDRVLELRKDLSQFLIHLTRTGPVKLRKDVHPKLERDRDYDSTGRNRLKIILETKTIRALSPYGHFNYKVPIRYEDGYVHNEKSKVQRSWLKCACFTETPFDHIHIQTQEILGRKLQFEPYGLAFTEKFLASKGASPVMYYWGDNEPIKLALDEIAFSDIAEKFKPAMSFFESFGPGSHKSQKGKTIDFRWEREWRTNSDIDFEYSDVAFGLCKTIDIEEFEKMVGFAFPFVDPVGDEEHLAKAKDRLRLYPKLRGLK